MSTPRPDGPRPDVVLPVAPPPRVLAPGRRCRVRVAHVDGSVRTVWEGDDLLLEAPNWGPGDVLLLNGAGLLHTLPVDGSRPPQALVAPGLPAVNNDHVLSPDGRLVYASAADWHVHVLPWGGGAARRVTSDPSRMHFLHGVSPDGTTLAYVALEPRGDDWWHGAHLRLVGVDGHGDRALTGGARADDGPEFSPDGRWVYFSTEAFTTAPGHAQIARVRPDGTRMQRLTHGARVDWFPHCAPRGPWAVHLSYPPGTLGHPADLPVRLHLVRDGRWDDPAVTLEVFGGQGTLNVNSWAPQGDRFAYVDYPGGG